MRKSCSYQGTFGICSLSFTPHTSLIHPSYIPHIPVIHSSYTLPYILSNYLLKKTCSETTATGEMMTLTYKDLLMELASEYKKSSSFKFGGTIDSIVVSTNSKGEKTGKFTKLESEAIIKVIDAYCVARGIRYPIFSI